MGRSETLDYPRLTKLSFAFGVGLFAVGALGGVVGSAVFGSLPGWEQTLFFDAEVLGLIIALVAPLVFGIVMPLTE
jgi:hypothetical protein